MGMDGLSLLLRYQWAAYWRRILRGGNAAKTNLLVLGIVALVGLARFLTFLRDTSAQVAAGKPEAITPLMAGMLLIGLLPFWDDGSVAIGPRELWRYPLPLTQRFLVRISARFIPPLNWIAILFSILALWPFLRFPNPVLSVLNGILLLWISAVTGLILSHLAPKTATALLMLMVATVVGLAYWHVLSINAMSAGVLLPLLLMGAAGATWLAWRTFPLLLAAQPKEATTRTRKSVARFTLLRKELRYFSSLGGERLLWVILLLFAGYLLTATKPEPDAMRVVLAFTGLMAANTAMNLFGLDYPAGLDRYALSPLSGKTLVARKDEAFALISAARWSVVLLLGFWRFGLWEGGMDLLEAGSILLGSLAWGNVVSIRHPARMDSGESGGMILDALVGMFVSAGPGLATIAILRSGTQSALWSMAGMLLFFGILYAASLYWAARQFTRRFDAMRRWLS